MKNKVAHVLNMIDPSLRLAYYSYGKRSATPVETFKNVLGSSQKFQFLMAWGVGVCPVRKSDPNMGSTLHPAAQKEHLQAYTIRGAARNLLSKVPSK